MHEEVNMAKSTIAGTYKIHVGNYDWGCSVDKAILTLDREMGPGDIGRFTDIRVRERKLIADESGPEHEILEVVSERKVTGCYLSDENGEPADEAGSHVTIELYVSPEEGSPLVPVSKTQIFVWSDPYELRIECDGLDINPVSTGRITEADVFRKESHVTSDGTRYDYAEYVPENEVDTLYVWLHGLGEGQKEGSDVYLPLLGRKGCSMAGREFQDMIGGARVLVPQCPTYWMDRDGKESNFADGRIQADGTSYYTDSLAEFIQEYREEYHLKRVVLAGCSNGGYMCLMLALRDPDRYCAVVPICEAVPDETLTDEQIRTLAGVPLYFVYSLDDPIVDPEVHEIPTIQRLREAGCKDLHVSETDQVIDTSGKYRAEDGSPYCYMGHLSWIYYDNNVTNDGNGLSAWAWIARKIAEDK